jgi:hypothetical protein
MPVTGLIYFLLLGYQQRYLRTASSEDGIELQLAISL